MTLREWALIIFTVCAQMSVGSFLVLGVVHYFSAKKADMAEADQLSDRALIAVVLVLLLGLFASLFHLGNPLQAYTAITNFGSSWLSREVLCGVAFLILGSLFAFMQWKKIGSFGARNVVAWLAAAVGVVLVYAMGRIYMLPTQPAWNTIATPILFYTTTLLLGSLAIGAALVANYTFVKKNAPDCADVQCDLMNSAIRGISIASVVLLGIELVTIAFRMALLASGSSEAAASAAQMIEPFGLMFILQLALAFIGAGVFAVFVYQSTQDPTKEKGLINMVYGAFSLVLIAEVIGRFLFYASHVQILV